MKVLIFSNMYPTEDKPQFGIYVYNQVKLLESMGVECKVVSLKSKGHKYLRYMSLFFRGMYYALIAGRDYDLVHGHYAFPPGVFASVHKKRYGSKMVVTVHGSDIYKMPVKSTIIKNTIKKIIAFSDCVICVSNSLKDKIYELYHISDEKTRVINMGVNTDVFKWQDKMAARKTLNLKESEFVVLFAGNFYAAKGVKDLILAFKRAQIPKKRLVLVGDAGVESSTARFVDNTVEDSITITGPKPQRELAKFMAAADLFALPSYSEGFNLVTVEAMSVGTLVLTSDIPAFDYLSRDTVLKSKAGDVEGIKNALERAVKITKSPELDKYLKNAKEIVDKNDYQRKAEEVYKIYDSLVVERC